jgi:hypothetical protein
LRFGVARSSTNLRRDYIHQYLASQRDTFPKVWLRYHQLQAPFLPKRSIPSSNAYASCQLIFPLDFMGCSALGAAVILPNFHDRSAASHASGALPILFGENH